MKFIPFPFYHLNRLRGAYSIWAKYNAIILGVIFGFVVADWRIGLAIAVGYLAGESMGWGEWIGGIIRNDGMKSIRRDGRKNGIEWIATRFTDIHTLNYHILALFIRGIYWWLPALGALFFVISPFIVGLCILLLGIGFPASVLIAKEWNRAEYIYGAMQDVIIFSLLAIIYFKG